MLGHSLGEYAAAQVAGFFSLRTGWRWSAERGRLTERARTRRRHGRRLAPAERVRAELSKRGGEVAIAAYNGPENVVVSGRRTDVEAVLADLESQGVRVKMLRVPYASHSPRVEPLIPGCARPSSACASRARAARSCRI